MKVDETDLPGVVELTPKRFEDDRGWFSETWNAETFAAAGLEFAWVQDNESFSANTGTVRGIHFQIAPGAQEKLVRVVSGRIFDVAVDLRRSSPTFGQWVGLELRADTGNQLLVPKGFGHGFATLTDNCQVAYKVSSVYDGSCDRSIAWDDPDIGIDWPFDTATASLSRKDQHAPRLADAPDLFA